MSDQQSPIAPDSSKSEAVEESASNGKPYTVEDGKRLWRDIQAETGFYSYQQYLRHYEGAEGRSDLRLLRHWMKDMTPLDTSNECFIVDVLTHEDLPPKLSTRCQTTSGPKLLAAIRQPPKHVRAQIIIWSMRSTNNYPSLELSQEILDILGTGLRIDPQFFLALIDTFRGLQQSEIRNEAVETRPLRPSHVVIDRAVATFVRHYPFNEPVAAPTVLIAGDIDCCWETCGREWDFTCVADQRINNCPPFTRTSDPDKVDVRWLQIFSETFNALAGNNPGFTSCTAAIIAGVLMPLLQMNCFKVRAQFLRLRRRYLALQAAMDENNVDHQHVNHTSSKLHHERFWLRRSVEDSADGMSHFESYISAEDANCLPESSAYLKIKQETGQIHSEARRLDAEVRDYLQLVVGQLSLEESRKSIELSNNQIVLSNNQILEGKRVKIFTILAFVYIPLNLATSIFGMNLQQLNKSGQNLWVFIVTGVVALLVTGVAWFCVELITSYKGLPQYGSTADSRRNQSLVFRLALLVWLVRKGHTIWMCRSGAWLCILSNDKLGSFLKDEKACDYVYRFMQSKNPRTLAEEDYVIQDDRQSDNA